jgi:fused signal recognition particle receptor
VDTAGRLQTQRNLLEELAKVGRVATRALDGGAYESLLVLDAVLGLSSLSQARAFHKAIPMTGLVLAKLDGSAKGRGGGGHRRPGAVRRRRLRALIVRRVVSPADR